MTGVVVERGDRIGRIVLSRPERKNALDQVMADALSAAVRELALDPHVRVIAVAAAGKDFCAGADLQALDRLADAGPDAHREDAAALGNVFLALRSAPKATVALVRGRALAGGAGLATACDIVLAADDATFGYPEVRVGFVPAMVMTMLRRCVGEKQALDLVLSGRPVPAVEAQRMGLVSRVLPAGSFEEEAGTILESLAAAPAEAVSATKRLFVALDELSFAQGIAEGIETNVAARATDEFREGVRRFLSRRGGTS